ncbi:MAG: beta-galactosidase [Clostridia bacterium]|nr:beta-galactosidase [Clostridia bacterium]
MLKFAGLNTVETCVWWNLHKSKKVYSDFSGMLDIVKLLNREYL